jgi:hypothetical protein
MGCVPAGLKADFMPQSRLDRSGSKGDEIHVESDRKA